MNKPIVSIILPTFNRGYCLAKSIDSVLTQTYKKFELIVIDDASTDNTVSIIQQYQKQDNRIKYILNEKRGGANYSRNAGIKASNSDFIAFQDSDAIWLPEKLEKQMKAFEALSKDYGVVYTAFWKIKSNYKKTYVPSKNIPNRNGYIFTSLLKENLVDTPSAVIQKRCLEEIGLFDESLPRLQDWELFIRIAKKYKFKLIDEALFNSYYPKDSIGRNKSAYIEAKKKIINKHFLEFQKELTLLRRHYRSIARTNLKIGNFYEFLKYLIKSYTKIN